jgi:hypothetical protein
MTIRAHAVDKVHGAVHNASRVSGSVRSVPPTFSSMIILPPEISLTASRTRVLACGHGLGGQPWARIKGSLADIVKIDCRRICRGFRCFCGGAGFSVGRGAGEAELAGVFVPQRRGSRKQRRHKNAEELFSRAVHLLIVFS